VLFESFPHAFQNPELRVQPVLQAAVHGVRIAVQRAAQPRVLPLLRGRALRAGGLGRLRTRGPSPTLLLCLSEQRVGDAEPAELPGGLHALCGGHCRRPPSGQDHFQDGQNCSLSQSGKELLISYQ
jgi:hypothetical protein